MDARTAALWRRYAAILPPLDTYPLQSSRFRAGETLAGAGEPITRLCFVVEGLATVHNVMENGRAVLLREYSGVQTVGELELLMDYPVHASAVKATTAGAMLLIPFQTAILAHFLMHDRLSPAQWGAGVFLILGCAALLRARFSVREA